MNALYHTLFDIYDSLISLATNLVHLHETSVSTTIQEPISVPDLTDLLAGLSLPTAPRPRQSNCGDPGDLFVALVRSFDVCTGNMRMAVKTYDELKIALARTEDDVIISAWERLDETTQSVGKLYETLKAIVDEMSPD